MSAGEERGPAEGNRTDLFRIIAEFFENRARYHSEPLWRMKISIEGVRPALLSEDSHRLLDSLRAFRHFFTSERVYSYKAVHVESHSRQ